MKIELTEKYMRKEPEHVKENRAFGLGGKTGEQCYCIVVQKDDRDGDTYQMRKDYGTKRGRHSTSASSSSSFDHPSSSHYVDDDNDENEEGIVFACADGNVLFISIKKRYAVSSLMAMAYRTTPSSFESKPHSLPLSSRNIPSPQPTNPFLDDPLDAPLRPSNPLPLQSHPSLDITLSISAITPLDHMFETSSPPPPPQPPLMGHPIFFNILDYHGAHCLCGFHNQNLILSLRDEMHFMFSPIEYLLTSAIASPSTHHH
nr:hypothetical protein [Tanacetum cinerariifolium]